MTGARTISGCLSLALGLATVIGVVLWMLREPPPPAPPPAPPPFRVPVTVVRAEVGDVSERIELTGDVQAPDRALLAFERAGRIRELPIRLGDLVRAGDVLARLDDEVMEHEVKASEASLAQAREMADLARREAERLEKIGDVVASAAQLDRAQAEARNAAALVAQEEADLALERTRLKQGILSAPFDAIVTARPVALGSYVAAGDPCCELLSLELREVLLELPPHVAVGVRPGTGVILRSDELPDFELAAELSSVLPSQQARERSFTGVVRLGPAQDPERRLVPGVFVRAELELRAARGAATVPVDCVLEGPPGPRLVIALPGEQPTAAVVPVRVLARDDRRVAFEPLGKELAADAAVILIGKENAAPGVPLQIADQPPAEPAPPAGGEDAAGQAPEPGSGG